MSGPVEIAFGRQLRETGKENEGSDQSAGDFR
jgi:hypothetical protein